MILSPRQFASAIKTLSGYVADDAWNHIAGRVLGGAKSDEDVFGSMHFSPAEQDAIRNYRRPGRLSS